jgi:hypothetical protein
VLQRLTGEELRGHERENRHREHCRDAQPPRHVVELRVRLVERHDPRFEGHAADRAGPGLLADDLRVHRTGPLRAHDRCGRYRLERHAAFRARARACSTDLGVHRAGVLALVRCRVDWRIHTFLVARALATEECVRRLLEPLHAARAAEVVGATFVFDVTGRAGRENAHPADRVDDCSFLDELWYRRHTLASAYGDAAATAS